MRLLVLLSRVPYPLEKGDKLRAYHLVRRLAQRHQVHLFCLTDAPVDPAAIDHLRGFCADIEVVRLPRWRVALRLAGALFGRVPYQVAYFHHGFAQRRFDRLLERVRPDHVLCQLVRTTEYVLPHHAMPRTLDLMDTLSKGMERRVRRAPIMLRPLFKAETRRLIAYENRMIDQFDHCTIISAQDRGFLYHPRRDEVVVVPNGVDTGHFAPMAEELRYDLVFTGNMNYPPNVDSALHLVTDVLPLVRRERPDTSLLISGADPGPRIRALAEADGSITVTGWVSDIRQSYATARVFVAPMRIGTGLQNKILEAMAMGLPCVTSPLANNALGARPGEAVLIGRDAAEHAAAILALLGDRELHARIAGNGRRFVQERFGWEQAVSVLEATMGTPGRVGGAGAAGPR